MSTSGLLWAASKIIRPDIIDEPTFNKWYEQEHIRDILATSQMKTAFRYQNVDPSADRKFLALYPVKDVGWLGGEEFMTIPVESELFKTEGKTCFDFADFDTRFYEYIHGYEAKGVKAGPAKLIISAALTPAVGGDDDFNRWYKDENYRTLSECRGYVRSRRYKLKTPVSAKNVPTYLALHEFDGESLPVGDLEKSGNTPWSKKITGSLVGEEVMVFALIGSWGDIKAKV